MVDSSTMFDVLLASGVSESGFSENSTRWLEILDIDS